MMLQSITVSVAVLVLESTPPCLPILVSQPNLNIHAIALFSNFTSQLANPDAAQVPDQRLRNLLRMTQSITESDAIPLFSAAEVDTNLSSMTVVTTEVK